jgi:hypothetical protein
MFWAACIHIQYNIAWKKEEERRNLASKQTNKQSVYEYTLHENFLLLLENNVKKFMNDQREMNNNNNI